MKTYCPNCHQAVKVAKRQIGKIGPCPFCLKVFQVNEAVKVENRALNSLIAILLFVGFLTCVFCVIQFNGSPLGIFFIFLAIILLIATMITCSGT